ncbi:MAG: IS630 family transposase, partial [Anaerolineae bacterium]|nr:IS630 family transposase [Anaerolineae bacterium]
AMRRIVLRLPRRVKRRVQRVVQKTRDAAVRTRALIILHYANGRGTEEIAQAVHYNVSGVRKVRQRFLCAGESALLDQRRDNGQAKADEDLKEALRQCLASTPGDFGWSRTTWTQELLAHTLYERTGISVSPSTVARMLRAIGARWGQPKPVVTCWWPKRRRTRRLREIRALIENLPENEVALYEDEVDIHLNPKIGRDWMLPGTQRLVVTPGKNEKHYLAGALNAKSGEVHYVNNGRKNGYLFRLMLDELAAQYPKAAKIHVIVDNCSVHSERSVQRDLSEKHGGRIKLHFLPPYCPDHNKIERLWREVHANVTRNHRCGSLRELLAGVYRFLDHCAPYPGTRVSSRLRAA